MENTPMHHVSIGFLPEGFHPLHRFLSLSNRQERPASKLDRVLKASAILWHSVLCQDRQFRFTQLSEVTEKRQEWTAVARAAAVVGCGTGAGAPRAAGTAQLRSLPHQPGKGRWVVSSGRGRVPSGKFGAMHSIRATTGFELRCG